MARLSTEQAMQLFRTPRGLGEQSSENLRAVAESGKVLTRGVQPKAPAEEYRWLEQSGTVPVSSGFRCRSDLSHPGQPGADVRQ